eukprot:753972-Hanusia_phi.AAC.3
MKPGNPNLTCDQPCPPAVALHNLGLHGPQKPFRVRSLQARCWNLGSREEGSRSVTSWRSATPTSLPPGLVAFLPCAIPQIHIDPRRKQG